LKYQRQLSIPILFKEKLVGKYYLDFLVEDLIIIELKQGNRFSRNTIEQAKQYLVAMDKQLAILANFTSSGVKFMRILNIHL